MDKKSRYLILLLLISILYIAYLTYDQTVVRKNFEIVNYSDSIDGEID